MQEIKRSADIQRPIIVTPLLMTIKFCRNKTTKLTVEYCARVWMWRQVDNTFNMAHVQCRYSSYNKCTRSHNARQIYVSGSSISGAFTMHGSIVDACYYRTRLWHLICTHACRQYVTVILLVSIIPLCKSSFHFASRITLLSVKQWLFWNLTFLRLGNLS